MIIILKSWTQKLFNCNISLYNESVVLTISVKFNFRENVIATITKYDPKRKLHVTQKRQVI